MRRTLVSKWHEDILQVVCPNALCCADDTDSSGKYSKYSRLVLSSCPEVLALEKVPGTYPGTNVSSVGPGRPCHATLSVEDPAGGWDQGLACAQPNVTLLGAAFLLQVNRHADFPPNGLHFPMVIDHHLLHFQCINRFIKTLASMSLSWTFGTLQGVHPYFFPPRIEAASKHTSTPDGYSGREVGPAQRVT